jgi:hypothetical protein
MQVLTQRIKQRGSGIELEVVSLPVHSEGHLRQNRRIDGNRLRFGHQRRRAHDHRDSASLQQVAPCNFEVTVTCIARFSSLQLLEAALVSCERQQQSLTLVVGRSSGIRDLYAVTKRA